MPQAQSVIEVLLGEAGGFSEQERYENMLALGSVIWNRAVATGVSPEKIIAGSGQFDSYGKNLPKGTPEYRSLAEKAWDQIQKTGPVNNALYFSKPETVANLPKGLQSIGKTNDGHVLLEDPQSRPLVTSAGVRPIRQAQQQSLPESPPIPTSRTQGLAQGAQMMAPGGLRDFTAPDTLALPDKFGGNVFQDKEYQNFTGGLGKPLGTYNPANSYAGGLEKFFGQPVSGGVARPDSQGARQIVPGLGLGNLAPPQAAPEMAGEQPNVFGPPGGVDFNLGPLRPHMPDQRIVDITRSALDYVYGPDYKMEVFSGKGNYGSPRHPSGKAIDTRFYTPEGRRLDTKQDREGLLAIAQAANAKGALGTGLGTKYMAGDGMHLDTFKPGRGQAHQWGDIASANAALLAEARATGLMPLPMRMAPPQSKPVAMAAPVGQVERIPLPPIPAAALPPEGMARGMLAGLGPTVNNRPPPPPTFPGRPAAIAPTAVRPTAAAVAPPAALRSIPMTPVARDFFPAAPRGPSRAAPVRLDNPISVGQPGGRYGGTGLSAMMGVRSGMSPVGTVARSASNPDVMNVSLPHGNVAHVNTKHGFISTWSPADDDERGTVFGSKVVAIDPTGSKYSYVTPSRAQELAAKGWTTYGPGTKAGPSKGFAKSAAGPASSGAQRGGLLGMLSGIFGGQQGRGPASSGFGMGRGGVLGLPGPVGLAAGLFGPGAGMGGLGLGGFSGGGSIGGGYGNPGFGGSISSNNNYGGL